MSPERSRPAALDGLGLAVGTLTVLRVPAPTRVDARRAAVAMTVAPLAVIPAAAVLAVVGLVCVRIDAPPLVAAVLVVAASALVTRGLHLDGLADTADGLASSFDRSRALAVMRSGDTGPAGVVALVLTLMLQVAAAGDVLGHDNGWLAVAVTWCSARVALPLLCARGVPAARSGGLGATVAGTVPIAMVVVVLAAVAGAMAGAGVLIDRPWWQGTGAVAASAIAVGLLLVRCRRRFGGITGDILGTGVEVSSAVLLVGLAAGGTPAG